MSNSFYKANTTKFKDALYVEARGLELLRKYCKGLQISVPKVLQVSESELIMERIEPKQCHTAQSFLLGQELAKMHDRPANYYGLDYDNMIGLNRQRNTVSDNWGVFFFECRLMPQVEMIKNTHLKNEFLNALESLRWKIENLLNTTVNKPSLLHGDLWSGNYMCDQSKVWLIDPAVYFGDREVDIAMTQLFGGFSDEFYRGYESIHLLSKEFFLKERIFNLYHYLNHWNLFGDSYFSVSQSYLNLIQKQLN